MEPQNRVAILPLVEPCFVMNTLHFRHASGGVTNHDNMNYDNDTFVPIYRKMHSMKTEKAGTFLQETDMIHLIVGRVKVKQTFKVQPISWMPNRAAAGNNNVHVR